MVLLSEAKSFQATGAVYFSSAVHFYNLRFMAVAKGRVGQVLAGPTFS